MNQTKIIAGDIDFHVEAHYLLEKENEKKVEVKVGVKYPYQEMYY